MPQLRRSSRYAVVDNCQGHELTVVPKARKTPEDCFEHTKAKLKLADAQARLRYAGKMVNRTQNAYNIDKYNTAKNGVKESRENLMMHLLTCETCKG